MRTNYDLQCSHVMNLEQVLHRTSNPAVFSENYNSPKSERSNSALVPIRQTAPFGRQRVFGVFTFFRPDRFAVFRKFTVISRQILQERSMLLFALLLAVMLLRTIETSLDQLGGAGMQWFADQVTVVTESQQHLLT